VIGLMFSCLLFMLSKRWEIVKGITGSPEVNVN